jgi:hypothetical protein
VVAVGPEEFELQSWRWQGSRFAEAETIPVRTHPGLLRVAVDGAVEHRDAWRPEPPMLEPPGDAYTRVEHASSSHRPGEVWRARGRQVIVERAGDDRDLLRAATESLDHFLVHRPGPGTPEIEALESDWKEGRLHGIVLELETATRPAPLTLLRWAGSRGALVYLEPPSWGAVEAAVRDLLGPSDTPLLLVDPALSGRGEREAEVESSPGVASALDGTPGLHLVLSPATAAGATEVWERHPACLLIGGMAQLGDGPRAGRLIDEATENLRYLTERTTLRRLR